MKFLIVVGTRPEAIKLASVVKFLRSRAPLESIHVTVCSTGQHTELLDMTTADIGLRVDREGSPVPPVRSLTDLLSHVISGAADHISAERPDLVVVQGDTTSALGSALAAFNLQTPVCHIEAGLRSFRQWEPYPEEMNRRLLARLASFHFTTTLAANTNLIREGIEPARVFPIQNPLMDTLFEAVSLAASDGMPKDVVRVVVTIHRREERRERLQSLLVASRQLVRELPRCSITVVTHPALASDGDLVEELRTVNGVTVVPPQPYTPFVNMLANASVVVTDSGGVSEEAAYLGVPLVVFRRVTERADLVEGGIGVPVGVHPEALVEAVIEAASVRARGHVDLARPRPHVGRSVGKTLIDVILPVLGDVEMSDLR